MSTNTFAILAADGSTAAYELGADVNSVDVYLKDTATDGGGTAKLQSSFDGGTTWVDVASASWTSGVGYMGTYTVFGRYVRINLAGATSPTNFIVTVKSEAVASYVEYVNLLDDASHDVVLTKPGAVAVFAEGTWDSGSLTVTESPDGVAYYDSGYTALTADGGEVFTNPADNKMLSLELASVATACDLNVWIYVSAV